jgi:hypothetical protein
MEEEVHQRDLSNSPVPRDGEVVPDVEEREEDRAARHGEERESEVDRQQVPEDVGTIATGVNVLREARVRDRDVDADVDQPDGELLVAYQPEDG